MECEPNVNDPAPMNPKETRTNLIINHLPQKLSENEFQEIFSKVGTIKSFRIMKDLKTGASFGFGFVEYDKPESAARAILQLNNYALQHKRLKVSYARPPEEDPDTKETNLYIQNLPRNYTQEQLEAVFEPYGTIVQKLIFKDKATGAPRGIAFVRFSQPSEAYSAIQGMDGRVPEGGIDPLHVKLAKDRNNKKPDASYIAGYQAGLARGRARGHFSSRGVPGMGRGGSGIGRGGTYSDMGSMERGFSPSSEFSTMVDYGQGGKIAQDRSNNRYNPIGGGGGYPSAGLIPTPYAPNGSARGEHVGSNQYNRMTSPYSGGFGNGGASYASNSRPGPSYCNRY